jgi:hypothetical protein
MHEKWITAYPFSSQYLDIGSGFVIVEVSRYHFLRAFEKATAEEDRNSVKYPEKTNVIHCPLIFSRDCR